MFARRTGIEIKSSTQLDTMRAAGLVVAKALSAITEAAKPGVSTGELDAIARDILSDNDATSSFLGYKAHGVIPYPAVLCASVNDEVVHGIPGPRRLQDGDLVSIDFGAIVDGWHGDAAVSILVGEVAPQVAALCEATRQSLWAGLAAARLDGHLTDISHAVESCLEGAGRYGIVADYGGHGIGSRMHMEPHILNYGRPGRGPILKAGMALAIEPMATLGSPEVGVEPDGWTVTTLDGSWACHWEHTVAVTDAGPWVLTAMDDTYL